MTESEVTDRKELHLDHRHLTFFFVGAVMICAIFFVLGFIVGRGQAYEASIKAQSVVMENSPQRSASESVIDSAQKTTPSLADSAALSKPADSPISGGLKSNEEGMDYRKELDFYSAVKDQKVEENFNPSAGKANGTSKPGMLKASKDTVKSTSPKSVQEVPPEKLLSLQVAALTNGRDAENLAMSLRSKGYPVFIVRPNPDSRDKFIRIQVGPFKGDAEAAAVKGRLEKDGYKPIAKR
jgi:cell division septation protein DedD